MIQNDILCVINPGYLDLTSWHCVSLVKDIAGLLLSGWDPLCCCLLTERPSETQHSPSLIYLSLIGLTKKLRLCNTRICLFVSR